MASRDDQRPGLVGALSPDAVALREGIERLGREVSGVDLLIGPEGDFSPAELERAIGAGFIPVSLGEIVLRVETAVLYCLSVLKYELG